MVAGFNGLNIEEMRSLALEFDRQASELGSAAQSVTNGIHSVYWVGPFAVKFEATWTSVHRANLSKVEALLRDQAKTLRAQAQEQEDASASGGGLSSPVPGDPVVPPKREPLPSDIVEKDPLTPGENTQGQVGDCWLISTINAMMETEEGRKLLRDGIKWDPAISGYQVRLFVFGKETWVPVTDVIGDGAKNGTDVGVVSLYEAAVKKEIGNVLLNSNLPSTAIMLVGDESSHIYIRLPFAKISDDAVASGGSGDGGITVAGTPPFYFGGEKLNGVDVKDVQATADPMSGSGFTGVHMVADHAYEVVDIKNGMIGLRNPWGSGNWADGPAQDGNGVFYISQHDFDNLFAASTQTEFTGLV